MDEERLKYIASKISDYDEYLPIVAFLDQLEDDDKTKFIEYVRSSGYWKENDLLNSIMDFVRAYVKEKKIDVRDTKDEESSLDKVYSNFSSGNSYSNMSMWDIASMYYAKQDENSDTKKR